MKKLKESAKNGLIVLGLMFLIVIALSFFYPSFNAVEKARGFIIIFYVCIVAGDYFFIKARNK